MQSSRHILRFAASPADFERAFSDVRAALDTCGIAGRPRHNAELVFEEIVSNLIRHGGDGRAHAIDITVTCDADALVLTFDDDGQPFDPLQRPDPTLPTSLDDAPLGGLGIFLVRKASTNLHYERTADQKNRLIVTIATN